MKNFIIFFKFKKNIIKIYLSKVLALGGDNVSYLALMSEEDLVELSCRIGMAEKPLHFQRFVKVLGDWQINPTSFTNEIDNFDMHPENSIKVKKNAAKDIEHRIRQLCEDFCDQADEELTEEQKVLVQTERSRLASEFGNDFDTVQRYCIEKFLTRNNARQKRENILDEEILLQI